MGGIGSFFGSIADMLIGVKPMESWLLWLLFGLLVLLLVAAGVLLFIAARRRYKPAAPRPVPGAEIAESTGVGLAGQFARADRALRRLIGVSGWRYRTPWFMILGENQSGKSAVMNTLAASGIGGEQGSSADECRFWFFERGVVLDPAGRLILERDGTRPPESGWRQFLHLLQSYRPKRPIDGIIVALSCEDLLDRSQKGIDLLRHKAAILREHLTEAQRQLGIRPAVWVLLTKSDGIPGFSDFAAALPPERRGNMLGWSSPYNPDSPFTTEWVDDAIMGVNQSVEDALIELLASKPEFPGGSRALQFPGELLAMRETLADCLAEMFRPPAYQEPAMLRGLYFTGMPGQEGQPGAPTLHAFVHDVFSSRIFPEFALSQPTGNLIVSTNRRVRFAQVAVVCLAVLLGAGLTWTVPKIARESAMTRNTADAIIRDLGQLARRDVMPTSEVDTTYRDATNNILTALAGFDDTSLLYAFIPSSWASNLRSDVRAAILVAYNRIIIDGISRRLHETAEQLADRNGQMKVSDDTARVVDPGLDELPEFQALASYVERISDLDLNVRLYQSIPRDPDVETIGKLVGYLYKIELPQAFYSGQDLYEEPLRAVTLPPFDYSRFSGDMSQRVDQLANGLADVMSGRNAIARQARDLARLMTSLAHAGGAGKVDLVTLVTIRDAITRTEAALASPSNGWLRREQFEPPQALERLLNNIGQSRFFSPALAQAIRDRLNQNHQKARQEIMRIQADRYGTLVTQQGRNGPLTLSQRVQDLKGDLDSLLNAEFAKAQGTGRLRLPASLPASARLKWNASRLERALDLYFQYVEFAQNRRVRETGRAQAETTQPVLAAGADQLLANMIDQVAQALTIEPVPAGLRGRAAESVVAAEAANLGEVSYMLTELIQAYADLGAYDSEIELSRLTQAQAGRLMRQIDQLLGEDQLYGGTTPDFSWWDGTESPALRFFGVSDRVELTQYLALHRERLIVLARNYAQPAIQYLLALRGSISQVDLPILSKWQRLLIQLELNEKKVPASSLSQLEQFVTGPMTRLSRETCPTILAPRNRDDNGADYFLAVRDRLESALRGRCQSFGASASVQGFRALHERYRAQLSPRFPFAEPPPRRPSDEVRPDEVEAFFRLFDETVNQGAGDPLNLARYGNQAPALRNFVDSLDRVRVFLGAGKPESPAARRPSYALEFDFRMEREREVHASHVIDWTVTIGDKTVGLRDTDRVLLWRYGDPITIRLRWAKDAPTKPRSDPDASPFLEVGDGTAVFRYDTGWSLLALLRDRKDLGGTAQNGDDLAQTLLLPVPVSATDPAQAAAIAPFAKLFLKLRVMTPATTQRNVIPVPDFVIAPPIIAMN